MLALYMLKVGLLIIYMVGLVLATSELFLVKQKGLKEVLKVYLCRDIFHNVVTHKNNHLSLSARKQALLADQIDDAHLPQVCRVTLQSGLWLPTAAISLSLNTGPMSKIVVPISHL